MDVKEKSDVVELVVSDDEDSNASCSLRWACSVCTLWNEARAMQCDACASPKQAAAASADDVDMQRGTSKTWTCSACTLMNASHLKICELCEHPRPDQAAEATLSASAVPAPAQVPSVRPSTPVPSAAAPKNFLLQQDCSFSKLPSGAQASEQDSKLEALRRLLGPQGTFRPGQARVVDALLAGRDVLYVFPTGAGKSLCYQLPSLLAPPGKFGLVISPLIALMEDQVRQLRARGIAAVALHSERSASERNQILAAMEPDRPRGKEPKSGGSGWSEASHNHFRESSAPKLVYMSPELITSSGFAATLKRWAPNIALVAVDEAHCVSKWGHDFRPCYRCLGELRTLLPSVPWAACTATATNAVREDVALSLRLKGSPPLEVLRPFDRPNLRYSVIRRTAALGGEIAGGGNDLLDIVTSLPETDSGIIYCQRQRDCERIADLLQDRGVKAMPYHAGLSKLQRQAAFSAFLGNSSACNSKVGSADTGKLAETGERLLCKGAGVTASKSEARVLVATIAFGMGVDKPDVRFVAHAGPPKSLSAYYQESGRAGRDGKPALCLLFYAQEDIEAMRRLITAGNHQEDAWRGAKTSLEMSLRELEAVQQYCETNAACRRRMLLCHFGDPDAMSGARPESCCDACARLAGTELQGLPQRQRSSPANSASTFAGFRPASEVFASCSGTTQASTFVTARQLRGAEKENRQPLFRQEGPPPQKRCRNLLEPLPKASGCSEGS